MPPGNLKAHLREEALARRDALDAAQRNEMSLRAADHGDRHIEFQPGTVISGFLPIRSEIDVRPLLERLRVRGARLCLPVILDRQNIVFREFVQGTAMARGNFGTMWPMEDAAELDPQILLMPLAVFDAQGNRIGYGAGYYDRAIERVRAKGGDPLLIGFAFSTQETHHIEHEPHDQRLDALITELGFRRFGREQE